VKKRKLPLSYPRLGNRNHIDELEIHGDRGVSVSEHLPAHSGFPGPWRDDMVQGSRDDAINDKSKDSIARDLFPLTSEEQKRYSFELAGRETLRGRNVYRVRFRPLDKGNLTWAGDALIDAEEFEPVSVFTRLSRRIPFWVRTLLGTNLPGFGYNVEYRRFDQGVWFPVSFGTEFRLHAVFFINREITISLENSAFERTKVETRILDYQAAP
jgi:hypothetical protein